MTACHRHQAALRCTSASSGTRMNEKVRPHLCLRQSRSALGSDRGNTERDSYWIQNGTYLLWTGGFVSAPRDPQDVRRRMLWPPSKQGGDHDEAETQALEQRRESAALCETIYRWLRELASRPWIHAEYH